MSLLTTGNYHGNVGFAKDKGPPAKIPMQRVRTFPHFWAISRTYVWVIETFTHVSMHLSSTSTNNSLWCIVHSTVKLLFLFPFPIGSLCGTSMFASRDKWLGLVSMVLIEKHVHIYISINLKTVNSTCWICSSLYSCRRKFVLISMVDWYDIEQTDTLSLVILSFGSVMHLYLQVPFTW
jgi:hypothetical protein